MLNVNSVRLNTNNLFNTSSLISPQILLVCWLEGLICFCLIFYRLRNDDELLRPQADLRKEGGTSGLQVDYSGCLLGLVDIKTKVAFWYMLLILKHNFCLDVNNT